MNRLNLYRGIFASGLLLFTIDARAQINMGIDTRTGQMTTTITMGSITINPSTGSMVIPIGGTNPYGSSNDDYWERRRRQDREDEEEANARRAREATDSRAPAQPLPAPEVNEITARKNFYWATGGEYYESSKHDFSKHLDSKSMVFAAQADFKGGLVKGIVEYLSAQMKNNFLSETKGEYAQYRAAECIDQVAKQFHDLIDEKSSKTLDGLSIIFSQFPKNVYPAIVFDVDWSPIEKDDKVVISVMIDGWNRYGKSLYPLSLLQFDCNQVKIASYEKVKKTLTSRKTVLNSVGQKIFKTPKDVPSILKSMMTEVKEEKKSVLVNGKIISPAPIQLLGNHRRDLQKNLKMIQDRMQSYRQHLKAELSKK